VKYHQLGLKTKSAKRVGRGISAGGGKTAGRGTKGQNSRAGGNRRPGFEGGQNPLYMRLPKMPGFKSKRVVKQAVSTGQLNQFKAGSVITSTVLEEQGLVSDAYAGVKIIFKGDLKKSLKLNVQAISARAETVVTEAGGSVEIVARPQKSAKQPKTKAA